MNRARRGYTLVEILIAAFLFVLVGLIIFTLFDWGIESQARGKLKVDTNNQCRTAIKRMRDEMATATVDTQFAIPVNSGGQVLNVSEPSAVLQPSYLYSASYDSLVFYELAGNSNPNNPPPISISSGSQPYRLVYYYVTGSPTNPNGHSALWRQVFSVQNIGGQPPAGVNFDANEQSTYAAACNPDPLTIPVTPQPFPTPSTVPSNINHFYLQMTTPAQPTNLTTLQAVQPAQPPADLVISLPGPNDYIGFSVTHAQILQSADYSNQAAYDPNNFTISVLVYRTLENGGGGTHNLNATCYLQDNVSIHSQGI
jgi:type II secretory pathway pseudopilin PulG